MDVFHRQGWNALTTIRRVMFSSIKVKHHKSGGVSFDFDEHEDETEQEQSFSKAAQRKLNATRTQQHLVQILSTDVSE